MFSLNFDFSVYRPKFVQIKTCYRIRQTKPISFPCQILLHVSLAISLPPIYKTIHHFCWFCSQKKFYLFVHRSHASAIPGTIHHSISTLISFSSSLIMTSTNDNSLFLGPSTYSNFLVAKRNSASIPLEVFCVIECQIPITSYTCLLWCLKKKNNVIMLHNTLNKMFFVPFQPVHTL